MYEAQFAKTIAWLLRVQALLAGLVALPFGLLAGMDLAMAALVGGAIGILLTAITALRVGMSLGQEAQVAVRAFYRAMLIKLVLAVIIFVIVAKWFAGYFGPVITGYAVTSVAYWMAMKKLAGETQPK